MEQEGAEVVVDAVPSETSEAVREAYDRIANPNQEPKTEAPTAEKPPEAHREDVPETEELVALREQAARIPELQKQVRDVNGRYGALVQKLDAIQQRLSASDTASATAQATADSEKLLADVQAEFGEYPELAERMKAAFAKVLASTKPGVAAEEVDRRVAERMQTQFDAWVSQQKAAAFEEEKVELSEAHPDWREVRTTPEYKAWLDTLPEERRWRFLTSEKASYVSRELDAFKGWKEKQAQAPTPPAPEAQPTTQKATAAPSKRLQAAVLPTQGTKPGIPSGDDKQAQVRAAYERVAGNRR